VLDHIPADIACLDDYEQLSVDFLPHAVREYIASGNADEITLKRNREAFEAIQILPRVLQRCENGSTSTRLFGQQFKHPFLLAPVAHQALVHPQAELATAQAADAMRAGMVASTFASHRLEEIAAQTQQPKWFQIYWQTPRENTLTLLKRAEAAGYSAIVVTVDLPVTGMRNRDQRAGAATQLDFRTPNLDDLPAPPPRQLERTDSLVFKGPMADAPDWDDLKWLKQQTKLPVLVKGILHAGDALMASQIGLDGVVVSNHGGRSLDGIPAAIQCLAGIRKTVGDQFTILVDGGIRRGSDIFKALALGADAVLIGRPQVFALAVAGALGVAHMLRILEQELEINMALAGCPRVKDIKSESVLCQNGFHIPS